MRILTSVLVVLSVGLAGCASVPDGPSEWSVGSDLPTSSGGVDDSSAREVSEPAIPETEATCRGWDDLVGAFADGADLTTQVRLLDDWLVSVGTEPAAMLAARLDGTRVALAQADGDVDALAVEEYAGAVEGFALGGGDDDSSVLALARACSERPSAALVGVAQLVECLEGSAPVLASRLDTRLSADARDLATAQGWLHAGVSPLCVHSPDWSRLLGGADRDLIASELTPSTAAVIAMVDRGPFAPESLTGVDVLIAADEGSVSDDVCRAGGSHLSTIFADAPLDEVVVSAGAWLTATGDAGTGAQAGLVASREALELVGWDLHSLVGDEFQQATDSLTGLTATPGRPAPVDITKGCTVSAAADDAVVTHGLECMLLFASLAEDSAVASVTEAGVLGRFAGTRFPLSCMLVSVLGFDLLDDAAIAELSATYDLLEGPGEALNP